MLRYAFSELVASGFSAVEALRSITSIPANGLGVGPRKGRIVVGADADLVAVHGDPTSPNGSIADVAAVWHAGNLVT